MSSEWDEYAAGWDEDARVHDYADKAFAALKEKVALAGKRVLDFGCGTGVLSAKVAPLAGEVVAIDSSPAMIAAAERKAIPNVRTIAGSIEHEAVREAAGWKEGYDLVLASSVCGFVENFPATARRLFDALRPGGLFVQWDWLAAEGEDGMTRLRVDDVLRGAGFAPVDISQPFTMGEGEEAMPVLMAVARRD